MMDGANASGPSKPTSKVVASFDFVSSTLKYNLYLMDDNKTTESVEHIVKTCTNIVLDSYTGLRYEKKQEKIQYIDRFQSSGNDMSVGGLFSIWKDRRTGGLTLHLTDRMVHFLLESLRENKAIVGNQIGSPWVDRITGGVLHSFRDQYVGTAEVVKFVKFFRPVLRRVLLRSPVPGRPYEPEQAVYFAETSLRIERDVHGTGLAGSEPGELDGMDIYKDCRYTKVGFAEGAFGAKYISLLLLADCFEELGAVLREVDEEMASNSCPNPRGVDGYVGEWMVEEDNSRQRLDDWALGRDLNALDDAMFPFEDRFSPSSQQLRPHEKEELHCSVHDWLVDAGRADRHYDTTSPAEGMQTSAGNLMPSLDPAGMAMELDALFHLQTSDYKDTGKLDLKWYLGEDCYNHYANSSVKSGDQFQADSGSGKGSDQDSDTTIDLLHRWYRRHLDDLKKDSKDEWGTNFASPLHPSFGTHSQKWLQDTWDLLIDDFLNRKTAWRRGTDAIRKMVRSKGSWRPHSLTDILALNIVTSAMIEARQNSSDTSKAVKDAFISSLFSWRRYFYDQMQGTGCQLSIYTIAVKRIWGIDLYGSYFEPTDNEFFGLDIGLENLKTLVSAVASGVRFDEQSSIWSPEFKRGSSTSASAADGVSPGHLLSPLYEQLDGHLPRLKRCRGENIQPGIASAPIIPNPVPQSGHCALPPSHKNTPASQTFAWLVFLILLVLLLFVASKNRGESTSGLRKTPAPDLSSFSQKTRIITVLGRLQEFAKANESDDLSSQLLDAQFKEIGNEFPSSIHLVEDVIAYGKTRLESGLSDKLVAQVDEFMEEYCSSLQLSIIALCTRVISEYLRGEHKPLETLERSNNPSQFSMEGLAHQPSPRTVYHMISEMNRKMRDEATFTSIALGRDNSIALSPSATDLGNLKRVVGLLKKGSSDSPAGNMSTSFTVNEAMEEISDSSIAPAKDQILDSASAPGSTSNQQPLTSIPQPTNNHSSQIASSSSPIDRPSNKGRKPNPSNRFPCGKPDCTDRLTTMFARNRHMRSKHGLTPGGQPISLQKVGLRCSVCGVVFDPKKRKDNREAHEALCRRRARDAENK